MAADARERLRARARDPRHPRDRRDLAAGALGGARQWSALSFAIACALLTATWIVAGFMVPDLTRLGIAGVTHPVDFEDFLRILGRNATVLAFHAMACVAGFIAGASMPIAAQNRTGISRWVHIKAGELAILYVVAVTLFSLSVQAYMLGFQSPALSDQLHITNLELILSVTPHALIELTALFLPLAAWVIAARKEEWNQLLAATFVTVVIAIPMLVLGALLELFLWPQVLIDDLAGGLTWTRARHGPRLGRLLGTPLPRKLGIKEGATVVLVSAPERFERTLGELPPRTSVCGAGTAAPRDHDLVRDLRAGARPPLRPGRQGGGGGNALGRLAEAVQRARGRRDRGLGPRRRPAQGPGRHQGLRDRRDLVGPAADRTAKQGDITRKVVITL